MSAEDKIIERLKNAIRRFGIIFPHWEPRAKDLNIDTMVIMLKFFPAYKKARHLTIELEAIKVFLDA